ncbi:MAG: hypothetical protein LBI02_10090 [Opitutaceae bacterium]|nr:hypothetical protein [Opitutaceae bacterium]
MTPKSPKKPASAKAFERLAKAARRKFEAENPAPGCRAYEEKKIREHADRIACNAATFAAASASATTLESLVGKAREAYVAAYQVICEVHGVAPIPDEEGGGGA